eukprot:Platyproteum_vivax@DN5940_c0_g1_i2.p1
MSIDSQSEAFKKYVGMTGSDPNSILRNPNLSKGTAFTEEDRVSLHLRGLLPPAVESIELQVERVVSQFRSKNDALQKYTFLNSLKNRNLTLFYKVLAEHLEEMLPIVYTPTVGQACLEFAYQFRIADGMYFSAMHDKGQIRSMLDNWKVYVTDNQPNEVAIIVVTDGSRILGLGDLGTCGMGIPVGKLSLYIAAGGFNPAATLPVVLDMGCDRKEIRDNRFYLGGRHERVKDDLYHEFWKEFMDSVQEKWPRCVIQFEDISVPRCFDLLEKFRYTHRSFNDDIQGTGVVIAAGVLNALKRAEIPIRDHKIVFFGAGSAGIGVADQIVALLSHTKNTEFRLTEEEARSLFYFVDSKGLVHSKRNDLQSHKIKYARSDITTSVSDLLSIVKSVKATGIIGLSGQSKTFTKEIIKAVSSNTNRPIIFPLSNPTANSECSAEDAFVGSDGRCLFASGSPFPPCLYKGTTYRPNQGNNMYVFPGIGMGVYLSQATVVTDNMLIAASETLAQLTTKENLESGALFPPLKNIRSISAHIAAAVWEQAVEDKVAESLPCAVERLYDYVVSKQYVPEYTDIHLQ